MGRFVECYCRAVAGTPAQSAESSLWGAVVAMRTVTPAGPLVDAAAHKRACVIVVGLGTVAAAAVILTSGSFNSANPSERCPTTNWASTSLV